MRFFLVNYITGLTVTGRKINNNDGGREDTEHNENASKLGHASAVNFSYNATTVTSNLEE
jgi:hypothetical protein